MYKGLIESKPRTYLQIADGHIVLKQKDQEPKFFPGVVGIVTKVAKREANVNGTPMAFLDITLKSGEEEAVLSTGFDNGVARSLIYSLANVKDFSKPVQINVWARENAGKTYTNVALRQNGEKVGWAVEPDQVPKGRPVTFNGQQAMDYTDRLRFVENLFQEVVAKLGGNAAADDDMPVDI